jgi:Leucine-rich repeat (LRR) protein
MLTYGRSVSDDPGAIIEDEQDRLLLEDLELERRASLVHLAEAERQYAESSLESPLGTAKDTIEAIGLPLDDPSSHLALTGNDHLVISARDEIKSIRSSLSRNSIFNNSILQEQVARHSQRISIMLAEDQNRLSQRWSQRWSKTMATVPETAIRSSALISSEPAHLPAPLAPGKLPSAPSSGLLSTVFPSPTPDRQAPRRTNDLLSVFNPRTAALDGSFLPWVLSLELPFRKMVLQALYQDLDEWPGVQAEQDETSTIELTVRNLAEKFKETKPRAKHSHINAQRVLELVEKQIFSWGQPRGLTATGDSGLTVDLCGKHIKTLPLESVYKMTFSVTKLVLRSNCLAHLPEKLVVCRRLRHLDLSYNKFKRIPGVVIQLPLLETLNMRENNIDVSPYEIMNLQRLSILCLDGNRIGGLPPLLGKLLALSRLYIANNPITYPHKSQIDYQFPGEKDDELTVRVWTDKLKSNLRRLCGDGVDHLGT